MNREQLRGVLRRVVVTCRRCVKEESFNMRSKFALLSISDPAPQGEPLNVNWQPVGLRSILHLEFHDFKVKKSTCFGVEYDNKELIDQAMQLRHGYLIARWLEGLELFEEGQSLLIHCEAGVSLSPSVAMAIIDWLSLSRDLIFWMRHDGSRMDPRWRGDDYAPNDHVYSLTKYCLERWASFT